MNNKRILIRFVKNENNYFCDDFESLKELKDFLSKNSFIHIIVDFPFKETERIFNRDKFETMMYDEGFNDCGMPNYLNKSHTIRIIKK